MELKDFAVGQKWIMRCGAVATIDRIFVAGECEPAFPLWGTTSAGHKLTWSASGSYLIGGDETPSDLIERADIDEEQKLCVALLTEAPAEFTVSKPNPAIKEGQVWITRQGCKMDILSVGGEPPFPILAAEHQQNSTSHRTYTSDGKYLSSGISAYDLMRLADEPAPAPSIIADELTTKAERLENEAKDHEQSAEAFSEYSTNHKRSAADCRARAAEYRRLAAV